MKRETTIVGQSVLISQLKQLALKVAETDIAVLIVGETGSGKDVLARFIHANSLRADKSFIPVNCGAIPPVFSNPNSSVMKKGLLPERYKGEKGTLKVLTEARFFLMKSVKCLLKPR